MSSDKKTKQHNTLETVTMVPHDELSTLSEGLFLRQRQDVAILIFESKRDHIWIRGWNWRRRRSCNL